jgi:Domain of unknown function (DUF5134)
MTPSWLTDLLAGLMLVVAAYCAGRLVFALLRQRTTEYDIDVVHLIMGVAMAGMLVPRLNPFTNRVWEAFFAIAAVWFAVRVVLVMRGIGASRTAIEHCGPHLIASLAMLYMYLAPSVVTSSSGAASGSSSAMAGMNGMAGMATTGTTVMAGVVRYPTLGLLLAAFMIGYSVLIVDRTPLIVAEPSAVAIPGCDTSRVLIAPRALNSYLIVMSITMAYMLIIML